MLGVPLNIVLLLSAMTSCVAEPDQHPVKQTSGVPYINPADNGGSQLDSSAGLGEPLNASLLSSKRRIPCVDAFQHLGHRIWSLLP